MIFTLPGRLVREKVKVVDKIGKIFAGEIYVVGLGPGDPLALPAVNFSLLRRNREVYLRTARHPVVPFLESEGVVFRAFDDLYEQADSFDEVYQKMTDLLIRAALDESVPVVFGVPGHPLVGEVVVRNLLSAGPEKDVRIQLWPAPSFLDALYSALNLDPFSGLLVLDGFQLCRTSHKPPFYTSREIGVVVPQVCNQAVASEVKLTLMEHFPGDHLIYVVCAAGIPGEERARKIPLYELDREKLDHLTTVYVPPREESPGPHLASRDALGSLVAVMERLLGPEGCPWDRQQNHRTLKKYLIEEAYEVLDAVDEGNMYKLCEELGDLLLQIIFHTVLAQARGEFTLNQVITGITEKLKRRHPHVFGRRKVKDVKEVLANWEAAKHAEEGKEKTGIRRESLLDGIPRCLPALQHAQKVQARAALVGFDWPEAAGAAAKMEEEWRELRSAWARGDEEALRSEIGDLFFAAVNVARLLEVNAEEALRAAVDKFIRRFRAMEFCAAARGLKLQELSLAELNTLWEEAKAQEQKSGNAII